MRVRRVSDLQPYLLEERFFGGGISIAQGGQGGKMIFNEACICNVTEPSICPILSFAIYVFKKVMIGREPKQLFLLEIPKAASANGY